MYLMFKMTFGRYVDRNQSWGVSDKLSKEGRQRLYRFLFGHRVSSRTTECPDFLLGLKLPLHLALLFSSNIVCTTTYIAKTFFYFNPKAKILEISFKRSLILDTKYPSFLFFPKSLSLQILSCGLDVLSRPLRAAQTHPLV